MGVGLAEHLNRLERFGREPVAILPAAIVQQASRAARLWCVVRSLDNPVNDGNGSGLVEIEMSELCRWLNRSERSVWRYIKEALSKGYLHNYRCEYGRLWIEYRGLRSLAKHLGLQGLGSIGIFRLDEIEHIKARATDIEAEKLQAQSDHQRRKEWGKFAKGAKSAAELLDSAPFSARVSGGEAIARGKRLIYLEPFWRPFGGSQQGIADRLGVSVRTVQYRLDNSWRTSRGLATIDKAQSARQVFEECPKEFLSDFLRLEDTDKGRYVFLGRRLFFVGCNLYYTGVLMRGCRYRQSEYRRQLEACYTIGEVQPVLQGGGDVDLRFKNLSRNEPGMD
jgi:DNA-binding Lrp family transcriptional regulator